MSIHLEILDAAARILGDSSDVYIEKEMARATEVRATAKQTGYTESKVVVHGMGYLADTRMWAKSFLQKITIPASSGQDHL